MKRKDEELNDIARLVKEANIPTVKYSGKLKLGDIEITVHVLDDGRRVIPEDDMARAIQWLFDSGTQLNTTASAAADIDKIVELLKQGGGHGWYHE